MLLTCVVIRQTAFWMNLQRICMACVNVCMCFCVCASVCICVCACVDVCGHVLACEWFWGCIYDSAGEFLWACVCVCVFVCIFLGVYDIFEPGVCVLTPAHVTMHAKFHLCFSLSVHACVYLYMNVSIMICPWNFMYCANLSMFVCKHMFVYPWMSLANTPSMSPQVAWEWNNLCCLCRIKLCVYHTGCCITVISHQCMHVSL